MASVPSSQRTRAVARRRRGRPRSRRGSRRPSARPAASRPPRACRPARSGPRASPRPVGDDERLLLVVGDEQRRDAGAGEDLARPPRAGARAGRRRGWRRARRAGSARGWGRGPGRARRAAAGRRRARAPSARRRRSRPTSSSTSATRVAVGPAAEAVADVAGDVEVREQRVVLEDHPDPALLGRDERAPAPASVRPPIAIAPRVGPLEAGDQAQRRRLAAAATARAARRSRPPRPRGRRRRPRATSPKRFARPATREAAPRSRRRARCAHRCRARRAGRAAGRRSAAAPASGSAPASKKPKRRLAPDLGRQRLEPDRREQQRRGQLLDRVQEHERGAGQDPAADERRGDRARRPRAAAAEPARRLLDARRDLSSEAAIAPIASGRKWTARAKTSSASVW